MSYQIPDTFSFTLVALVVMIGGFITLFTTSLLMWLGSFIGLSELDSYVYLIAGVIAGFFGAVKVVDSQVQDLLDKWS